MRELKKITWKNEIREKAMEGFQRVILKIYIVLP